MSTTENDAGSGLSDIRSAIKYRKSASKITNEAGGVTYINSKITKNTSLKSKTIALDDYNWIMEPDKYDEKIDYGNNLFPRLVISEFQPVPNLGWAKIGNLLDDMARDFTNLTSAGSQALSAAKGATAGVITGKETRPVQVEPDGIKNGTKYLSELLTGNFLNIFELPYTGNTYLKAKGDGWTNDGSGNMLSSLMQKVTTVLGGNGSVAMPEWQGEKDVLELETSFYLLNDNITNFKNNFTFLHALVSGPFWVQNDMQMLPPNLYQVECPGRFKVPLMKLNVTITYEGLQRNDDLYNTAVNLPSGILIPDAYKIVCAFSGLTKNNFNIYQSYQEELELSVNDPNSSIGKGRLGPVERVVTPQEVDAKELVLKEQQRRKEKEAADSEYKARLDAVREEFEAKLKYQIMYEGYDNSEGETEKILKNYRNTPQYQSRLEDYEKTQKFQTYLEDEGDWDDDLYDELTEAEEYKYEQEYGNN